MNDFELTIPDLYILILKSGLYKTQNMLRESPLNIPTLHIGNSDEIFTETCLVRACKATIGKVLVWYGSVGTLPPHPLIRLKTFSWGSTQKRVIFKNFIVICSFRPTCTDSYYY